MAPKSRTKTSRPADLQLITTRLTTDAKKRLSALSQVTGEPAYRHLEEGFWLLWKNLPEGERASAEAFIELVEKARARHKKE